MLRNFDTNLGSMSPCLPPHRNLTVHVIEPYDSSTDMTKRDVMLLQRDSVHLLQLLNLSSYVDCFARQGYVSLQSILDLSWEDLEDIGVNKLGIGSIRD